MASHKHQTSHQQPITETEKYSLYFPKQYKGCSVKLKNYKYSLWEYRSIHHMKNWNIDDIWIIIQ